MASLLRGLISEATRSFGQLDESELARLLAIATLVLGAAMFIAVLAAAATGG